MPVKWYGSRVKREIREKVDERLLAGAEEFAEAIRENIGLIQGPPRSKSDEYPHMDSRQLVRSVFVMKSKGLSYIAGTKVPYSMAIEELRPHVMKTLFSELDRIKGAMRVSNIRIIDYSGYSFEGS